jgi:hypothetical protein
MLCSNRWDSENILEWHPVEIKSHSTIPIRRDASRCTREPLLPLIDDQFSKLLSFANQSVDAINSAIGMPVDRIKSRVLHGVLIPALHELSRVAPNYSNPSP